jgi:hypothetical protein
MVFVPQEARPAAGSRAYDKTLMMTTEEINRTVKQNRNWIVVGVAMGFVLIAGYFGYEFAMTPDRPAVASASQSAIVEYIIDPRGMDRLTNVEQQQFLEDWRKRLAESPDDKGSLKKALTELSSDQRKQFIERMLGQFKEIVVDEAKQFNQMTTAERNKFVFKQATEFEGHEAFVRELAAVFGREGMSQNKLREWIFEHTTPAEREICIPYLEAIQRVIEQRRKERRAEAAANPTRPG